jgi:hypothetical protein
VRSFLSTIAVMTLIAAVACFAVALLAPVSAASEPWTALAPQGRAVDARALAPDDVAARVQSDASMRDYPPHPVGSLADADQPLQQVVAIGAVASAIRVPRPGPGALLMAGLIGVGTIAWRRGTTLTNQRLDASTVPR